MKKNYFIVLAVCLLFSLNYCHAQTVQVDNFKITIKKVKKISASWNINSSTRLHDDRISKLFIVFKVKSDNDDLVVDSNAFSLVDTANKLRYRTIEYRAWNGLYSSANMNNEQILKTEIMKKNGKPYVNLPKYDPSVKDNFVNYSIEGYQDISFPIRFGTKRKPLKSVIYFPPVKSKNFRGRIYFLYVSNQKKAHLEFYYKNTKIADVDVK